MKKNKLEKDLSKPGTGSDFKDSLKQLNILQIEERLELSTLLTGGVLHGYDSGFNDGGACSNDKCFNNDFVKPIAEGPEESGGSS